jgi:hypothetical protein
MIIFDVREDSLALNLIMEEEIMRLASLDDLESLTKFLNEENIKPQHIVDVSSLKWMIELFISSDQFGYGLLSEDEEIDGFILCSKEYAD